MLFPSQDNVAGAVEDQGGERPFTTGRAEMAQLAVVTGTGESAPTIPWPIPLRRDLLSRAKLERERIGLLGVTFVLLEEGTRHCVDRCVETSVSVFVFV